MCFFFFFDAVLFFCGVFSPSSAVQRSLFPNRGLGLFLLLLAELCVSFLPPLALSEDLFGLSLGSASASSFDHPWDRVNSALPFVVFWQTWQFPSLAFSTFEDELEGRCRRGVESSTSALLWAPSEIPFYEVLKLIECEVRSDLSPQS